MNLALLAYKRALDEDKLIEYSVGIASDLADIASVQKKLGEIGMAIENFDRALAINIQLGFKSRIQSNLIELIDLTRQSKDKAAQSRYRKILKDIK